MRKITLFKDLPRGITLKPGDAGYFSGPSEECLQQLEDLRQRQIRGHIALLTRPFVMS